MMSTWNKFCFTGGYIETNVSLPGLNNVAGLWPAIWTMGNLGRAGYGTSFEGMWPYSYNSCDVGTVANQSISGEPVAPTTGGDAETEASIRFSPDKDCRDVHARESIRIAKNRCILVLYIRRHFRWTECS